MNYVNKLFFSSVGEKSTFISIMRLEVACGIATSPYSQRAVVTTHTAQAAREVARVIRSFRYDYTVVELQSAAYLRAQRVSHTRRSRAPRRSSGTMPVIVQPANRCAPGTCPNCDSLRLGISPAVTFTRPAAVARPARRYDINGWETYDGQYDANGVFAFNANGSPVAVDVPPDNDDAAAPTPDDCRCETCKLIRRDRSDPSTLKRKVIHNYSYKPTPWRLHATTSERLTATEYFGVELETDNFAPGTRTTVRVNSPVDTHIASDMARPVQLWLAKSDSSVSGPEFVSHPATLAFWKSKKNNLSEMFKLLVHAGYRSHDTDRCGMHINISKTAVGDVEHLYRFMTMLYGNPDWSLKMSQRTKTSSNGWAALDLANDYDRRNEAEYAYAHGRGTRGRYMALNIPAYESRYEFRLPRGTLRLDRFFKNLEWTSAMLAFSREVTVQSDINPNKFMSWVKSKKVQYPHLWAFLIEKLGAN